jgi:hypothetical protein
LPVGCPRKLDLHSALLEMGLIYGRIGALISLSRCPYDYKTGLD